MITGAVYYYTDSYGVVPSLGITLMALLLVYIAVCMFTLPDVHRAFAKAGSYVLAVVIFILALLSVVRLIRHPHQTLDTSDPPYDLDKRMEISVSMVYFIIYAGVFVGTALVYPREFLCNLQSLWYLLCLPGFNIFLLTYSVVNMAKTNEGMLEKYTIVYINVLRHNLLCMDFCMDKKGLSREPGNEVDCLPREAMLSKKYWIFCLILMRRCLSIFVIMHVRFLVAGAAAT